MENNILNIIEDIDSLKNQIDLLRPLSNELEKRIMQKFRFDWNYHSNNIEGNQLSFGETKTFLLHGLTAKGKPLKDHLDIKGHNDALLMLEDIVNDSTDISEKFVRELHCIILQESYYNKAQTSSGQIVQRKIEIGKYKSQPNHVQTKTGEMHYFASPEETPAKMYDLLEWLRTANSNADIHPLITAALFHFRFISIHPFDDGNGRLARILMNLILMRKGFPPVIIKTERKAEYYTALQLADGGDEEQFVEYIGEQLIHSLNLYLKGAKGENIEDDTDLDKMLALLNKRIDGVGKVVECSKDVKLRLWNDCFEPLLKSLYTAFDKFKPLFKISPVQIAHSNTLFELKTIEELNHDFSYTTQLLDVYLPITIKFLFENFQKLGLIDFIVGIHIRLKYEQYKYSIELELFENGSTHILKKYSKLYNQVLSHDEIQEITKLSTDFLISKIEEGIKKVEEGNF